MTQVPVWRNRIAVLIPVYNNWRGLQASLRSLSLQSVGCDAIIIDDGSEPPIEESACIAAHPQSRVTRQDRNEGIVAALNRGLHIVLAAGHEYVARLDAGDRCLPERLEAQSRTLDENKSLMLVGSDIVLVDLSGKVLHVLHFPHDWNSIRRKMHCRHCFCHPAVMMRTSLFSTVGMYRPEDDCAEDYGFFFRVANAYPAANLPTVLTAFEVDPNGISMRRRTQQLRTRLRIQLTHFDYLLPESYLGIVKTLVSLITPGSIAMRARATLLRRSRKLAPDVPA